MAKIRTWSKWQSCTDSFLRTTSAGKTSRTMMDSLHYITNMFKDTWRKNEVVSVLFLDLNSAFQSVVLEHLLHNMSGGVSHQSM